MARRAVVLGGGGTLGIAWMTGLAAAMAEGGIQLSDADLFVGTSAGSVVGTQLAFGLDPKLMLAAQQAEGDKPSDYTQYIDLETAMAVLAKWFTAPTMTPEFRRELGAIALASRTMPEGMWLAVFNKTLAGAPWPAKPLKITAVDAATGDCTVWESSSGVELAKAVASSCTVPSLFPPVTINGQRYIDGGVRSGTNADLAAGYEKVLVIAPLASAAHPLGHRQMIGEIEQLRAAGAQVEPVLPDREALEVFGPSMMDATRRTASLKAGLRQGRVAADHLTAFWQ